MYITGFDFFGLPFNNVRTSISLLPLKTVVDNCKLMGDYFRTDGTYIKGRVWVDEIDRNTIRH